MKNDKKTIFGWCMYDLANSAYITTVSAALLPIYFKEGIVGESGVDVFGLTVSATAMWGFMLGFAGIAGFSVCSCAWFHSGFLCSEKEVSDKFCVFWQYVRNVTLFQ